MDNTNQEVPAQQVPAKRRRYADEFKQDAGSAQRLPNDLRRGRSNY